MKNFIKKNWSTIAFIAVFVLDSKYQFLEHFIKDPFWLNIFKGLGALLLNYINQNPTIKENIIKTFKKDGDIGGTNPPPIKDEK